MDIPFPYLIAGVLCIGYVIMLVVAARNRLQLDGLERWLLATLFLALLAQVSYLIGAWAGQAPFSALFGG